MTLVMQLSKLQICMTLSHALYNFSYAVDLKHDVRNGLTRRRWHGVSQAAAYSVSFAHSAAAV